MLKSFLESEANLAKRDIIEGKTVKEKMIAKRLRVKGEYYVAPTYNQMIIRKQNIGFFNVEKIPSTESGVVNKKQLLNC